MNTSSVLEISDPHGDDVTEQRPGDEILLSLWEAFSSDFGVSVVSSCLAFLLRLLDWHCISVSKP